MSKGCNIDSKFPIMSVENSCLISKEADITVAFKVSMPEIFTLSSEDYEEMNNLWVRACKVLPDYTIVHKQDYFVTRKYHSLKNNDNFFDNAYNNHFYGREYLDHDCYLFITKTTKNRMQQKSNYSGLSRRLIPKELTHNNTIELFLDSVSQFESILNGSEFIHLDRLSDDTLIDMLEFYFTLNSDSEVRSLEDLDFRDGLKVGSNHLCLHTISNTEDLPLETGTSLRYDSFSTDKSSCMLSFASPLGILLNCDHIYNQYLFIIDSESEKKRLEGLAKNMSSLSRLSRSNSINMEMISDYLDKSNSLGLRCIKAHFNVISWSDSKEKLKMIRNDVGTAISSIDCKPRHNTIDIGPLYWAGIPGNEGDFPYEECFTTFLPTAICFFNGETAYQSSLSHFGIRLTDRQTGKPVHVDLNNEPFKKGIINNYNKFILGPSGSGKSFFTNNLLRQYYDQGSHIVLIDTGNSYKVLCELINKKTKGNDGIYYTYTHESPISFNPFYTDDYIFSEEKKDSICVLLITLWKGADGAVKNLEDTGISQAVHSYISHITSDRSIEPSFNSFFEYVRDRYRTIRMEKLKENNISSSKEDFNIDNFLESLLPYYQGGQYDFLLNSKENIDLLKKRFIVFEIDSIKDNKKLFPVVTLIIMETFINKMRRLHGIHKVMLIEEAWKAIASANMAEYIQYLYKTVRKHLGEAIVVTQEVDDIINSPIVKNSIINNSDCKILLDQNKYKNRFQEVQALLGLTNKERDQILSINLALDPTRKYREVWIGLGGKKSAVYATEVSIEENLVYTTTQSEVVEVRDAVSVYGDYEVAIRELAEEKRNNKNKN